MRTLSKSFIKKNDYIVLLPSYDLDIYDSLEETIGNILVVDPNREDYEEVVKCINFSSVKQVIFVNSMNYFEKIVPKINNKKKIKWILTKTVASFTDSIIYNIFKNIMRFYDRGLITKIGLTDKGLYEILKKANYQVENLLLFSSKKYTSNHFAKKVGILSNDFDPKHNFYNQLTAIKLCDINQVKYLQTMYSTKMFPINFNINYEICKSIEEVAKNNIINMYINFTSNNYELFFKSMNSNIPCLLGNTNLFDDDKFLKEKLVLNSDDDVNEMANKINNALYEKNDIISAYKDFMKNYIKLSKKNLLKFIR